MTPLTERTAFTLAMAAFLVAALALTIGLSPTARRVPLAVIVPTLVLVLAQLAVERVPWLRERYRHFEHIDLFGVAGDRSRHRRDLTVGEEPASDDRSLRRRELDMVRWIAILIGLVWVGGFLIALPLYTLLYLRVRSRERWSFAVSVAVALAVALQAILAVGLRVRLYEGVLRTLVERLIGSA